MAVTHWYAVGLVERPAKGPDAPPRYDTVYQEAPGAPPLTRAQVQRYHAAEGGIPAFRSGEPPWTNPRVPSAPERPHSAPDSGPVGTLPFLVGAAAGSLWAVLVTVLPFVGINC